MVNLTKPNPDVFKVIKGREIQVGDDFRLGGWRATVTTVEISHTGLYMTVEFCVGESEYQCGEFCTLMDGPFTIIDKG